MRAATRKRRRITIRGEAYWLHGNGALTTAARRFLGRVDKAPARGQRISRQPWRAYGPGDVYQGIYPTRQAALEQLVDEAALKWHAMPPRQLTGTPHRFHGYVSTNRRVMTDGQLCHEGHHRSPAAARRCAERRARRLNAALQSAGEVSIL